MGGETKKKKKQAKKLAHLARADLTPAEIKEIAKAERMARAAKEKKKDKVSKKGRSQGLSLTHNPLGLKPKKKCCRSKPRCKNCPVVYARLVKSGAFARNDSNLPKLLKEARRW